MPKVIGRMMEELNDLYVERIRQVRKAIQTGKVDKIGNILTQYQRDRQRIIDAHMSPSATKGAHMSGKEN